MLANLLSVDQAVTSLRAGKLVAYPTESVYGLGCDPDNEAAVHSLLTVKSRSPEAGLILISDSFDRFSPYIKPVPEDLMSKAFTSWPGPVTWLFPRASSVPDWLAGKHSTIALRVSAHPVCRALCKAFGSAIVSTSANPGTFAPALTAAQVNDYFADRIDGVVEGALGDASGPSEIRDLVGDTVVRAAT